MTVRVLLAYGTLKEDEPAHLDAAVPQVRTLARGIRVPGVLYDLGAYPGAVLDITDDSTFEADLVQIVDEDVDGALAAYDAYEDTNYRRVLIATGLADHPRAWVYEWLGDPSAATRIEGGVWTARR